MHTVTHMHTSEINFPHAHTKHMGIPVRTHTPTHQCGHMYTHTCIWGAFLHAYTLQAHILLTLTLYLRVPLPQNTRTHIHTHPLRLAPEPCRGAARVKIQGQSQGGHARVCAHACWGSCPGALWAGGGEGVKRRGGWRGAPALAAAPLCAASKGLRLLG